MDFQEFFTIVGMGAMAVVVGLLAWSVRMVQSLAVSVSRLAQEISEIERDNQECHLDRRATAGVLGEVRTSIALLQQGQTQQGGMLQEIRDHLRSMPPPPARASRKAVA
jgi:uncharacterized alpha-E superfamily protein